MHIIYNYKSDTKIMRYRLRIKQTRDAKNKMHNLIDELFYWGQMCILFQYTTSVVSQTLTAKQLIRK